MSLELGSLEESGRGELIWQELGTWESRKELKTFGVLKRMVMTNKRTQNLDLEKLTYCYRKNLELRNNGSGILQLEI